MEAPAPLHHSDIFGNFANQLQDPPLMDGPNTQAAASQPVAPQSPPPGFALQSAAVRSRSHSPPSDRQSPTMPPPPPAGYIPVQEQAFLGSTNTPPPPAPDPPRVRSDSGGRSRSRNRRDRTGDSRSRSRSPSRDRSDSEERSDEESEGSETGWMGLKEDVSEPTGDELIWLLENHAQKEHSALEEDYFQSEVFFEPNNADQAFPSLGHGKIMWDIDNFQGTKEQPNTELIMRSPIVKIGGYDWQLKFYPRGDDTHYLSIYLECKTMQDPETVEFVDYQQPAFPFLKDHAYGATSDSPNFIKKRNTVAAQMGVVMFNPAEARTNILRKDAHRFSKQSADHGWKHFLPRSHLTERVVHCERQAMLRNDKLSFVAYIRVIDDPTGCLWAHDAPTHPFAESLLTSSLRPFVGQRPDLAAVVPLLHFEPFRAFVKAQSGLNKTVYKLQQVLWKMYSRTISERTRRHKFEPPKKSSDAISELKELTRALRRECRDQTVDELFGALDAEEGAVVGSNKLDISPKMPRIQNAINAHQGFIATPALLTIELKRQEFDLKERKWKKLTDRVLVDDKLDVKGTKYTIFSFATHCGDLQSNKHNAYVRPSLKDGDLWYAYRDGKATTLSQKQAIAGHEGGEGLAIDDEVIYAVTYVRDDYLNKTSPREEAWVTYNEIVNDEEYPRKANRNWVQPQPGDESNLPLREEQERFEAEQAERALTPDFMVDDSGDVIMSDSEDDTRTFEVLTRPSKSRQWYTKVEALGQDFYEGYMLGDQYQGEGHLITMSGDQYTGSFYAGKFHGQGTMTYAHTGDTYTGQWQHGQRHGQGSYTDAVTGHIFEGGWEFGKKKGAFVLKGDYVEKGDPTMCGVCYEEQMDTAFVDCGHVVCCKRCAEKVMQCPVCRKRVLGRLQIYGVRMSLE